jgi:hypothetical protein
MEMKWIPVLLAALLGAGLAQAALVTSTTFDGSGDVKAAANYDNGAPSNANPGLISHGTGNVGGDFITDFAVRQTGGLIANANDINFRGGAVAGEETIWEIEDARTDYSSYTNLSVGRSLVFWPQNGVGHELRILSGVVDAARLHGASNKDKTAISMKDGIFHAGSVQKPDGSTGSLGLKFKLLNGGTGSVTIGDTFGANVNASCYLDFETGAEGSFTLGENAGADAYWPLNWMLNHGQVSIDGVAETNRTAYLIERDGNSITIRLNPFAELLPVPLNGAGQVPLATDLVATFSGEIVAGSGNIIITNLTDATAMTIPVSDAEQVTISGATLTVNPVNDLTGNKEYAVLIEPGALVSLATGQPLGITRLDTWSFWTVRDPVLHPFAAGFSTTGGQERVSFQWQGGGGAKYALVQSPDLSFSNSVSERYFLGRGGLVSDESPLPPEDSGFWKVLEFGTSNGICVAQSGEHAGKLVRYDDTGSPQLLHAFGVNYYDAFKRNLNDSNETSFVEGFAYLRDHHIPVARVIAGGFWPKEMRLYFTDREEFFRRMDYFVAQAEQYGIGLVMSLFWPRAGELVDDAVAAGILVPGVDFTPADPLNLDKDGNPTYAEYTRALGRADSGSNAWITHYTRAIVERYGRSPAVWAWEFSNEYSNGVDHPNLVAIRTRPGSVIHQGMTLPSTTTNLVELPAWTGPDDLVRADVRVAKENFAQTVRSIDTWRLIMGGDSKPRSSAYHNMTEHAWVPDSRAENAQVLPIDNPAPMDTVTVHIYPTSETYFPNDNPATNEIQLLEYYLAESAAMGRPMILGEWGAKGDGSTAEEKATFSRFVQALVDNEVQLSMLWDFDNQNVGQIPFWWVNPGTAKEYQLTNDDPDLWDLEQANLYFQD